MSTINAILAKNILPDSMIRIGIRQRLAETLKETVFYIVPRISPDGAWIGFLTTDPEAAAILGRTRGIPAARSAMALGSPISSRCSISRSHNPAALTFRAATASESRHQSALVKP